VRCLGKCARIFFTQPKIEGFYSNRAMSGVKLMGHEKDGGLSMHKPPVEALELAAVASSPLLSILNQGNVSSEHFSKNGVTKQVHVVVKNLVFVIDVSSSIDLTKCNLEAKLLYDYDKDEEDKMEVSYVKNEPLEYKVSLTDGGFKASVELRIKVLTSQHEDMLFRVRLSALDPLTGAPFGVISQPIKVISKLTQLKGKGKDISPTIKKRTTNDMIATSLSELHRQLQEQNKYIHLIMHKMFSEAAQQPRHQERDSEPLHTLSNIITQQNLTIGEPTDFQTELQDSVQTKPEFEDAFRTFLSAYQNLQPEEKQNKLEGFLETVSTEELSEIFEVFEASPIKKKLKLSHYEGKNK